MNSEELELSLRTEFESYLKSVLAEMRQEATEFQSKIQTQFDDAFNAFAERFEADHKFDAAFMGSVAEHLRLARDEGARITADAMAEAEKLDQGSPQAAVSYDLIRDAVNEISSKDSQSAILKSLVQRAGDFAPRGAFFIIRHEQFVGWKLFGMDGEPAENVIRNVNVPTSADSILGAAVRSLSTVDNSSGDYAEDAAFIEPLQFGHPDRMYAIPLVARGKGVAVLYADYGNEGTSLNREALETLVRVAGLTVELLAASHSAKAENRTVEAASFENAQHESESPTRTEQVEETEQAFDAATDETAPAAEADTNSFAFSDSVSFPGGLPQETEAAETEASFEAESEAEQQFTAVEETDEVTYTGEPTFTVESDSVEVIESDDETIMDAEIAGDTADLDSGGSIEPAVFEGAPADEPAEEPVNEYEPAVAVNGGGYNQVVEPVIDAPTSTPAGSKLGLSGRPVDLPIEVPEDERRIHIDARRFARLLVSEIKLYNEKKVIEGRESQDLYDRLREAIDRSREMYEKRVQPPVAAKFDYFHYELVNSLAEGESERLGSSYPGAAV